MTIYEILMGLFLLMLVYAAIGVLGAVYVGIRDRNRKP